MQPYTSLIFLINIFYGSAKHSENWQNDRHPTIQIIKNFQNCAKLVQCLYKRNDSTSLLTKLFEKQKIHNDEPNILNIKYI